MRFPRGDLTKHKEVCPVIATINILGKKWHIAIVHFLLDKPRGFNEFKRNLGAISSKTLSKCLKEMVEQGIVKRKVHSSPIRVEYSLTQKGEDLRELENVLRRWGEKWLLH
ncbi:MAG TPA: transcriptional regulator [Euryarchaeota archaeon]|nr:transcriptional regulator [Euryarchaeota archaeon]